MKKIVLALTFLVFLASGAAHAQKSFRFGVQTSPTWTWMRTNAKKIEGIGSNWGFRLGAVGEYYFAPNYAIFGGLGFGFNQGGNLQNGYTSGAFWPNSDLVGPLKQLPQEAKLHYRLNYVEIPFGLKMRGGSREDNPLRFYAEIPALTIGFVSKALGDIRGDNDLPSNQADDALDINIREEVRGLALSWGVGGGIEYELSGSATLVAGLAYQQGFTDVTDNKGLVSNDATIPSIKEDSKATIRALVLRVGIFF
jgi:opacity protein-like surface antigen